MSWQGRANGWTNPDNLNEPLEKWDFNFKGFSFSVKKCPTVKSFFMGSFPQPSSKIKCVREPNSGFLATQMPIQGAKNEVLTLLSLHLILHGIVGINMKNFLQKNNHEGCLIWETQSNMNWFCAGKSKTQKTKVLAAKLKTKTFTGIIQSPCWVVCCASLSWRQLGVVIIIKISDIANWAVKEALKSVT